jgi:hypothetical protein
MFGIYPGYIYIPDKSWIYLKYVPELFQNISEMILRFTWHFKAGGNVKQTLLVVAPMIRQTLNGY